MKTINIATVENKVYKETLKNGLTIYVFPDETKGITMNLIVKYGSAMNDFRFKGESEYLIFFNNKQHCKMFAEFLNKFVKNMK